MRKAIGTAAQRPCPPGAVRRESRQERRHVLALVGGRVIWVKRNASVDYAEVWIGNAFGPFTRCKHVVLSVATRARVARNCPDCIGP